MNEVFDENAYWDAIVSRMPPEGETEDPFIVAMMARDQRKKELREELAQIDQQNRVDYFQDIDASNSFANYLDHKPVEPPIEDDPDIATLF